jgi:hypothetical protein
MFQKSKKRANNAKRADLSGKSKQMSLGNYASAFQKEIPRQKKQIIINDIESVTKYDEMSVTVSFTLVPSKTFFSKIRTNLLFDDKEVKSDLIGIPQGFGESNEFQLTYRLDMRGISEGAHTLNAEFHDLFSSCSAIKELSITYVPLDRKAAYREIPITKKVSGEDFTVVSSLDKEIYKEIDKARKNELDSKRDKW